MQTMKEIGVVGEWDRFLKIVSVTILVLSSALLLSSAFNYFFHFSKIEYLMEIRAYIGRFVLGVSIIFFILNLRLASHPLYEYWVTVMVGCITGVVYSFY
ncbi:hypothetical protein ACFLZ5_06550 [Thermodesulfobacteriota bacterium]